MKELTEKEIEDNYNLHIKIIKKYKRYFSAARGGCQ